MFIHNILFKPLARDVCETEFVRIKAYICNLVVEGGPCFRTPQNNR